MNTIEDFMYIILYIVMFASAVAVLFLILAMTQKREASVLQDSRAKASVVSESYHADDSQSHMRENRVTIKGTSVYSDIFALSKQKINRPAVFIEGKEITSSELDMVANSKPAAIEHVQKQIQLGRQYIGVYSYKFDDTVNDFILASVDYIKE